MTAGGRKRLMVSLSLLALATALWLLSSYGVAYRATRRSRPPFHEAVPAISWGHVESFRITTDDREDLGAWFIDGNGQQPAVLLLHGNGACRQSCLGRAEFLAKAGYPVMMISCRAHGDSSGQVNDFGYSARHDVVAAVGWLEQKRRGHPIVVWGTSLGAAAAIFAAEDLGNRVNGYILECPYRDLHTATRNRTEIYLPPVLDRLAYLGLLTVSPLVLSYADQISPLEAAAAMPRDIPVLVLAGSADQRARPEEANAIYERIKPQAELVIFEGADHMKLLQTNPAEFKQKVSAFLRRVSRVLKGGGPRTR